jgi:hypothetical protein
VRNVVIYVFDDVEVLDFAGPFEVFTASGVRSRTTRRGAAVQVFLWRIAGPRQPGAVVHRAAPSPTIQIDVLLVQGGVVGGTRTTG